MAYKEGRPALRERVSTLVQQANKKGAPPSDQIVFELMGMLDAVAQPPLPYGLPVGALAHQASVTELICALPRALLAFLLWMIRYVYGGCAIIATLAVIVYSCKIFWHFFSSTLPYW